MDWLAHEFRIYQTLAEIKADVRGITQSIWRDGFVHGVPLEQLRSRCLNGVDRIRASVTEMRSDVDDNWLIDMVDNHLMPEALEELARLEAEVQ